MVQTPQQRRANEQFAKKQEKKMGKPAAPVVVKKERPQKSPISVGWLYVLLFVLCGGLIFEAVRIVLGFF
ncbi:uncharacterized protein K489DRAFT_378762 [Dissoconium aciculare CBS 342.82]|uniref:Stress-associated endoplasmic reticulum protein n=1 Tax=Dissoconium aciculare CBS 342.82 TaxID=1314786 RepID=A0A6J3M9Q8_9PEZI|nr:uncharacterized protein K489DRAFT_378762 [Dissoconium aciculare CBS 342.82]KAF1824354.1 hypothetical protein K489DRAFT_378762 [Dissoconium aciculare CBS 342.82]